MLKVADFTDIPELKRMALQFKANSPYSEHPVDEDKIEETLRGLISGDATKGIILVYVQDFKLVGMLACLATEFIFSKEKYATELVWWVDPEHRKGPGKELQEAFVYWANKIGCKYINMSLLENKDTKKLKNIYKKLGFKLMEQSWLKEI
jgi:GNAT superfamily N-acetyltransferase